MQKNYENAAELAAEASFQDYCLGRSTAEITEHWDNWVTAGADQKAMAVTARTLVLSVTQQPTTTADTDEAWQQLAKHLSTPSAKRRVMRRRWYSVAASLLLLISAYGLWQYNQDTPTVQLATQYGESQSITLMDGTIVTLNANSEFTYPENWQRSAEREVWLEGEAFFEVAHNPEQPFIVHTTTGDIEVLGTSFEVSDRPKNFAVTLVEGSVQFRLPTSSKTVRLRPSEQLRIINDTLSMQRVDTEAATAWRFNRMEFKNTPMAEIISQMEDDFGWKIDMDNPQLLNRKVTAKVPENKPELLLDALAILYDLKIQKIAKGHYRIE